ncbi:MULTISPECIES: calcium/proton exchanger [unclassified Polaromonas]|uniref:calcium/proton exchanger n=1 Tax=unclassified Polaromonas TaxID=2638319 RepID=UPI0018CA299B|nr:MULTISPECIES: calcium/proton exchanger [unclassified Polaromonas]MBG6071272.1 Ca2+:H+ antiporter [Polaromonas sp. CG_9.7]MBG6113272.1 Ca2+:H+ antiporter [Polaromonas sp. CG_9.2]
MNLRAHALPLGLLLLVPLAPAIHYLLATSPVWTFLAGAVGIGVLADWARRATEQLAAKTNAAIGGLLNVSFGSIAEIVLAFFVLASGNIEVVRAQIAGSIIGTSLLGLGLAIVVGSIGRPRQLFNRDQAGQMSSLLVLVVIALLLPAVFDLASRHLAPGTNQAVSDEHLSLGVSVVLILLYAANLVYTLITHRNVFSPEREIRNESPAGSENEKAAEWTVKMAVGVLVAATVFIAMEAHLVSGALEDTAKVLGLSPVFVGVIVLAVIGTASDLFAASWFARQGKMGLALNICVGSAIQVALVVAPLLVIGSWFMGKPMNLVFDNPMALFAIASAVLIVNNIARDGETTWFEGILLIGVYLLLALAFLFLPVIA